MHGNRYAVPTSHYISTDNDLLPAPHPAPPTTESRTKSSTANAIGSVQGGARRSGSRCRPAGYNRQPSSACLRFSAMDTRSVFAGDGHHRPQRISTSAWGKRGRRERDRTDRRPSTLLDTVRAVAGIEMRLFVKPRILSQSKYTMENKQSRFVFSTLRSFRAHIRLAKLRGSETQAAIRT